MHYLCFTDVAIGLFIVMCSWDLSLSPRIDVHVWSPFLGCFSAARVLSDSLLFAGSLVFDAALVSLYWVFNTGRLRTELL